MKLENDVKSQEGILTSPPGPLSPKERGSRKY
jgi:hypothetical protein